MVKGSEYWAGEWRESEAAGKGRNEAELRNHVVGRVTEDIMVSFTEDEGVWLADDS